MRARLPGEDGGRVVNRRAKVEISIAGGVARSDFRSGDRFGALEVLRTEGDAWRVLKLTLARPSQSLDGEVVGAEDLVDVQQVLDLARAECEVRGLKVDGVTTILEPRI